MNFYSLLIVSLALSLDAFSISICTGLNSKLKRSEKLRFPVSFGFFQFFLSLSGAYFGFLINTYVLSIPKIIGGIIIGIVGILMLREGMKNSGECILVKKGMEVVLGISVSIDAFVIGFTLLNKISSNLTLLKDTLFIGFVTLFMSIFALYISRILRRIKIFTKYSDYLGGVILIIFGIKMIFF
jgi:manganese efflux pump family protein